MITGNDSTFPQLLLTLEVSGSTYRFAARGPLTLVVDGVEELFSHGLVTTDVRQSADLFGQSASSKSVAVQVRLTPRASQDVADSGVELYAARASLYYCSELDGGDFSAAQSVARGFVRDPIYADPADPYLLGFSIDRDLSERALYPPATAACDVGSFTSTATGECPDGNAGSVYPVPVGKPGYQPNWTSGVRAAYPAVTAWVPVFPGTAADYRVVVSLGRLLTAAAYVVAEDGDSGVAALLEDTDNLGNLVTYLDMGTYTGSTASVAASKNVFVGFAAEASPGPDGTGLRGLGDVVCWALSLSSLAEDGVDWARVWGSRETLNALGRVDTWITERVRPSEWLVSEVIPYFPVFLNDAGDGLYVERWHYDAVPADAEIVIDTAIPGYERITPVSWEQTGPVVNDVTVRGCLAAKTGKYVYGLRLSGDPDAEPVSNEALYVSGVDTVRTSALARRSRQIFGPGSAEVEAPTLQDRATMDRYLTYVTAKSALPRQRVGYAVPWRKHAPRVGMVALLRDPSSGLSERVAIVDGYAWANNRLELSVSVLPVP